MGEGLLAGAGVDYPTGVRMLSAWPSGGSAGWRIFSKHRDSSFRAEQTHRGLSPAELLASIALGTSIINLKFQL